MTANAKLKISVSPRKARLVVDLIRGLNAKKALEILTFTHKRAAKDIIKLVKSAIANYQSLEGQGDIHPEELCIKEIYVDSAGMLKRMHPVAKGMSHRIRKRKSRITLIVSEDFPKEGAKKKKPKKIKETTETKATETTPENNTNS